MTLETALATLSGLRWVAPWLDLPSLVGTMIAVNICNAIMCRMFARNGGYPRNLWMALGAIFGVWAVAVLLLVPSRRLPSDPTG